MVQDPTAEPSERVRPGPRTLNVVVVLLATCLSAAVPTAAASSRVLPVSVVLLVVLSVLAVWSSSGSVRQAVLLIDLLFVTVAVGFLGLWPVRAAVAVLAAHADGGTS